MGLAINATQRSARRSQFGVRNQFVRDFKTMYNLFKDPEVGKSINERDRSKEFVESIQRF